MLDHGLHFDIDDDLRLNYSKLWLSLISPTTSETTAERRKYAEIVGNIGPELVNMHALLVTFTNRHYSTRFFKRRLQVG
jgi:aarF domain-containing kinase